MKIKIIPMTVIMLGLAACTHQPSMGEKMIAHSEDAKKLGTQWAKGQENILKAKKLEKNGTSLVSKGNKQVTQGKKLISNGKSQIKKGNEMIKLSHELLKDGQQMQTESESQFADTYIK